MVLCPGVGSLDSFICSKDDFVSALGEVLDVDLPDSNQAFAVEACRCGSDFKGRGPLSKRVSLGLRASYTHIRTPSEIVLASMSENSSEKPPLTSEDPHAELAS